MPETYKRLYQGQPGTSAATVYTVSGGGVQAVVKEMRAVNTSTSTAASIAIFHGGTALSNMILPNVPLNPGEWFEWDGLITMANGDTLAAMQSIASIITLTVYGVELT